MHWHPLRFLPVYQPRIWGDRSLAHLYQRSLPGNDPIGESWEITDRPEGMSVVAEGPLQGQSLSQLLTLDPQGLLGRASPNNGRFPLLVKILTARENLSVQVHPPASIAPSLGGEPKTEVWFFTDAQPGAEIFAGLKPGTTRVDFERAMQAGVVDQCLHRSKVHVGDAMFLPSGRVHALGAGLVLFEIQENSDTTYRVFDWNRPGLDGRPRPLHVPQSLASIDFQDIAPALVPQEWTTNGSVQSRVIAQHPRFRTEVHRSHQPTRCPQPGDRCLVLGLARGRMRFPSAPFLRPLAAGDFCLIPSALRTPDFEIEIEADSEWLTAEPGPYPHSNHPPSA